MYLGQCARHMLADLSRQESSICWKGNPEQLVTCILKAPCMSWELQVLVIACVTYHSHCSVLGEVTRAVLVTDHLRDMVLG